MSKTQEITEAEFAAATKFIATRDELRRTAEAAVAHADAAAEQDAPADVLAELDAAAARHLAALDAHMATA